MFSRMLRSRAGMVLLASSASVALTDLLLVRQNSFAAHQQGGSAQGGRRKRYPFVILGSGTAAHAALETLRVNDPKSEILIVAGATEGTLPRMDKTPSPTSVDMDMLANHSTLMHRLRDVYDEWRRQLSRGLGESTDQVSLIRADQVKINVEDRVITLGDTIIEYDKCLLATSGKPREFYVLDQEKIAHSAIHDHINTLHTALDFNNLASVVVSSAEDKKHITVVGGGFLGTEVTAALAETGQCKVTHVMGERTPLAQYLPSYLSEHVKKLLVNAGVDVRGEALVTGLKPRLAVREDPPAAQTPEAVITRLSRSKSRPELEEGLTLNLVGANQVNLDTDYVVLASTNVQPDLMGLDDPDVGLEVSEGGIVTNASLEAYHGLFVAGNAATYYDPSIGRRRVDTYDHALASGMWAAANMLHQERVEQYTHQPSFKSNLAGTGLCFIGVGKIDAKLETVGVWFRPGYEGGVAINDLPPATTSPSSSSSAVLPATKNEQSQTYKRGLVYYIERGRVVGVLLCNASEMLDRARDVLRTKKAVIDPINELPKFILLAPGHWLNVIVTK